MVNAKVKRDIANLSSGTMSELTGEINFEVLDKAQVEFIEFALNSEETFNSWQDAWNAKVA